MKIKRKTQALSYLFETEHQRTTPRRTWHSQPPSSIRRPPTIGPKGCEVGVIVWKFKNGVSNSCGHVMKRCNEKTYLRRAFHTSEPIEAKGTFEARRRSRHAIA